MTATKKSALTSFPDRNLRLCIVLALREAKKLPAFDLDAFYRRTTGKPYDDFADYVYEDIARELEKSPVTGAMLSISPAGNARTSSRSRDCRSRSSRCAISRSAICALSPGPR